MSTAITVRDEGRAISLRPISTDWRRPAWLGFLVIVLTFGVGGVWAAVARINGAIVAPGLVSIENHVTTIEHLEGGILRAILVNEGTHVKQGQVVAQLSDVQAKATLDTYRNEWFDERILEARLLAELDGQPTINLPADIAALEGDPIVQKAIADQKLQFNDRRRSLQSQMDILNARIDGLNSQIQGLVIEQQSTTKQVGYVNEELVGLRKLWAAKLVPIDRLLSMERERTRLEGEIGQAIVEQARVRNQIGETQMQKQELVHKFQEDTAAALTDTRQKISDLDQRRRIAQDIMTRIDITSPVSGTVQDLQVFGVGQVVRPGQPLMSVVPDEQTLVVKADFAPTDIAHVYAGQKAEVRFPAFHSRTVPVILGQLTSVSRDRITNEGSHQSYYLGLVSVRKLDIPAQLEGRLRAGMPAEVIVSSGSRTVLSYLTEPLTEAWQKSFRGP